MIVQNSKYPEILALVGGQYFQFRNGVCEVPDGLAVQLCGVSSDYTIIRESIKSDSNLIPFDPATWGKDYKKIIWDGPIGYNNGYGNGSSRIVTALDKYVDLYVTASRWQGTDLHHITPELDTILQRTTEQLDAFYIKFFPAWEFTRKLTERFIGYTMLEMSRIPSSWVANCNKYCERVIVPCEQQRQAFIESGVKRDVVSIPLGILPNEFPYIERPIEDEFVFGQMGSLTHRKGTDVLCKAFLKAFPKSEYPNVFLNIKTLRMGGIGAAWFIDRDDLRKDGRIIMNFDSFSPKELIDEFFAKIDCFVFPTRGEGFGLPPLEAMSTGLPVICTKWSGCAEFMDKRVSYPLSYKMVDIPAKETGIPYPDELRAEGQQWAEPDLDELVELMRYVYNNRDKAKAKGKLAASFVRKNFSADNTAQKLVQYLDEKF